MINLLPLEEKQKLISARRKNLTIVWEIIVLVSLICFALILFSIKIYILSENDYQKNILAQAQQQYKILNSENLSGTVQKYNEILAQLDSFYKKEIYFNQALSAITNVPVPAGLYITNFSLARNSSGIIQANISGISDTRGNLLTFRNNIEQDNEIKNPYFSPESWIDESNANFSLTFVINQNEKQQ